MGRPNSNTDEGPKPAEVMTLVVHVRLCNFPSNKSLGSSYPVRCHTDVDIINTSIIIVGRGSRFSDSPQISDSSPRSWSHLSVRPPTARCPRLGHIARLLPTVQAFALDALVEQSDGAAIVKDIRKDIAAAWDPPEPETFYRFVRIFSCR